MIVQRHKPLAGRWAKVRRGAATAEFAILCTFLLPVFFVFILDFGRVFYSTIVITNCAYNGALYASQDSIAAADTVGIDAAARADATNLDTTVATDTTGTINQSKFQVTSSLSSGDVIVTVTYKFDLLTGWFSRSNPLTLTRTVKMRVCPNTPSYQP